MVTVPESNVQMLKGSGASSAGAGEMGSKEGAGLSASSTSSRPVPIGG